MGWVVQDRKLKIKTKGYRSLVWLILCEYDYMTIVIGKCEAVWLCDCFKGKASKGEEVNFFLVSSKSFRNRWSSFYAYYIC